MDQQFTAADKADATDYGVRLRRRWWALVLGALVGLTAGYVWTDSRVPQFTSTASVLVLPTLPNTATSASGRGSSEINLNTESELVRSEQIGTIVLSTLKSKRSVISLLDQVTVAIPPNSQVLEITYVDRTREAAQGGAQTFAQAYLDNRTNEAKKDIEASVAAVSTQLETTQSDLKAAAERATAAPINSPERVYAEAQRNILINQITNLNNRLSVLTSAAVTPGQIITAAPLPTSATYPVLALNLLIGLVGGVLAGIALALLTSRGRPRATTSARPAGTQTTLLAPGHEPDFELTSIVVSPSPAATKAPRSDRHAATVLEAASIAWPGSVEVIAGAKSNGSHDEERINNLAVPNSGQPSISDAPATNGHAR